MPRTISYSRTLAPEERVFARSFVRRGEREPPVAFVGRSAIRQRVKERLSDIRSGPRPVSASQIIQGAPGAGKSCLLAEIKQESEGPGVTVVEIEGEDLNDKGRLAESFYTACTKDHTDTATWLREHDRLIRGVQNSPRAWDVIYRILAPPANHAFLLLVDEAQHIERDAGKKTNSLLTTLHAGRTSNLKILPVFAGLRDTTTTLFDAGLSRTTEPRHVLESLSPTESNTVVLNTLRDPRINAHKVIEEEECIALARLLTAASEGWPRHLHHYLQTFVGHMLKNMAETPADGSVDLDLVINEGNDRRIMYYDERLEMIDPEIQDLLSDIAESKAKQHLDFQVVNKRDEIFAFMSQRERDRLFVRLIHFGVLEPGLSAGEHYYPIPSFSTYMRCRRDKEQTKEVLKRALEGQMQLFNA